MKREAWRQQSVIADVAAHRIMGKGIAGYLEAVEWIVKA
jgi:3-dehydroquinate dehydratase